MATIKQIKYIQNMQRQLVLYEEDIYTDKQINNMSKEEISRTIEDLREQIFYDDMYNECGSSGLPNQ